MKFVGIVGSSAEQSYNRLLLEYIRKQFKSNSKGKRFLNHGLIEAF